MIRHDIDLTFLNTGGYIDYAVRSRCLPLSDFMEKVLQCSMDASSILSCFSSNLLQALLNSRYLMFHPSYEIFIKRRNMLLFQWTFIGNVLDARASLQQGFGPMRANTLVITVRISKMIFNFGMPYHCVDCVDYVRLSKSRVGLLAMPRFTRFLVAGWERLQWILPGPQTRWTRMSRNSGGRCLIPCFDGWEVQKFAFWSILGSIAAVTMLRCAIPYSYGWEVPNIIDIFWTVLGLVAVERNVFVAFHYGLTTLTSQLFICFCHQSGAWRHLWGTLQMACPTLNTSSEWVRACVSSKLCLFEWTSGPKDVASCRSKKFWKPSGRTCPSHTPMVNARTDFANSPVLGNIGRLIGVI